MIPAQNNGPPTRLDRRKAHTRQALVDAARRFLAEPATREVSIQQITEAADVGFGSFYNHFPSKEELFRTAVADVLEEHGQLLDEATAGIDDVAEVFAASVRISARLAYLRPQLARILTRTGLSYLISAEGLAPRALRDIRLAIDAGQFHVGNQYVALACAGGGLLGLLQLSIDAPGLVGDNAAEELAEQLLKMFGMPADTAHAIANRPLPEAVLP